MADASRCRCFALPTLRAADAYDRDLDQALIGFPALVGLTVIVLMNLAICWLLLALFHPMRQAKLITNVG